MILNAIIKKVSLFLFIGIAMTIMSCDERIAVDEDANYTITITQKAFVGSTYSSFSDENVVGDVKLASAEKEVRRMESPPDFSPMMKMIKE